jgi:hypothetical protein
MDSARSLAASVLGTFSQRSANVPRVFPTFSTSRSGIEERQVWKGQSYYRDAGG